MRPGASCTYLLADHSTLGFVAAHADVIVTPPTAPGIGPFPLAYIAYVLSLGIRLASVALRALDLFATRLALPCSTVRMWRSLVRRAAKRGFTRSGQRQRTLLPSWSWIWFFSREPADRLHRQARLHLLLLQPVARPPQRPSVYALNLFAGPSAARRVTALDTACPTSLLCDRSSSSVANSTRYARYVSPKTPTAGTLLLTTLFRNSRFACAHRSDSTAALRRPVQVRWFRGFRRRRPMCLHATEVLL